MTDHERYEAFLKGLAELPAFTGLTYRGSLHDNTFRRSPATIVTTGVTATSIDPRVATENAATREVYCISSRSGRDIAPFSAVPTDREVVLLPATVLHLAQSRAIETMLVHLVIELDPSDLGRKLDVSVLDDLAAAAQIHLAAVREAGPAPLCSPGKFIGDIV